MDEASSNKLCVTYTGEIIKNAAKILDSFELYLHWSKGERKYSAQIERVNSKKEALKNLSLKLTELETNASKNIKQLEKVSKIYLDFKNGQNTSFY